VTSGRYTHCSVRTCVGLTILLAGIVASGRAAAQNHYYASDGVNIMLVQRPPETARVTEWAAFYYKKGQPAGEMSARWGIETKNSPAAVMRSVDANQRFERSYEKWCGYVLPRDTCSWGENTFFNVMAPVALVKPESAGLSARQKQALDRMHEAWDSLAEFRDKFNTFGEFLEGRYGFGRRVELPVGSGPLAEFFSGIHETFDKFGEIAGKIEKYPDMAMGAFDSNLAKFAEAEARLNRIAEPAMRMMRGDESSGAAPRPSSSAMTITGNLVSSPMFGRLIPFTFANDGTRISIDIRDPAQGNTVVSVAVNDLDWEVMQLFPELKDYVDLTCRDEKPCISGEVNGRRMSVTTLGPLRCQQLAACKNFLDRAANGRIPR
jgi:hypothetical protein